MNELWTCITFLFTRSKKVYDPGPNPIKTQPSKIILQRPLLGSGCGSVGWAVASDIRGPQTFILDIYLFAVNYIEKTKIKKKRPAMAHLKNMLQRQALNVASTFWSKATKWRSVTYFFGQHVLFCLYLSLFLFCFTLQICYYLSLHLFVWFLPH